MRVPTTLDSSMEATFSYQSRLVKLIIGSLQEERCFDKRILEAPARLLQLIGKSVSQIQDDLWIPSLSNKIRMRLPHGYTYCLY
jgi:hypothetical protein